MTQAKFIALVLVMYFIGNTCATFTPERILRMASAVNRFRRATKEQHNAKWNATKADLLKRDLMANYDKFVRPAENGNTTVIQFDPTFHHIAMDEMRSIMVSHCWIQMSWTDEKLKWNESEYGGLSLFHLADHEIWQPDVVPYNSAEGSMVDIYGNTQTVITSDGTVIWVPTTILRTFCAMDLRKWPYDVQECQIKFGSWIHHANDLDLHMKNKEVETEIQLNNTEWKLIGITQKRSVTYYNCCPNEPYVDITYTLTVARQAVIYKTLVISPITAIVLMTLSTFWLPAASREKISLGAVTILIISIFLLYFSYKLPALAGGAPLIASFYSSSLYLVAFSIIVSVIVINMASRRHGNPLPWIIKTHLTGKFGQFLLFQTTSFQISAGKPSRQSGLSEGDTADNQPVIAREGSDDDVDSTQRDWILLATAIDRITFLLYCFLFIAYALAYLT